LQRLKQLADKGKFKVKLENDENFLANYNARLEKLPFLN